MRIATLFVFLITLASLTLSSCSSGVDNSNGANAPANMNAASNSANTANDNIEELGMLVTLPQEPEDASWKETTAPDGSKKLVAVIRFTDENAEKIASQAAQHQPPVHAELSPEEWFPPELISQSEISGTSLLKGQSYAANDFYREAYNSGKVTHVENTDYFILELTSR